MKLALLSDLHANRQATESVWQHAQEQGIDQVVLLGDYVDYGADPAWVVEFCRDLVRQGRGGARQPRRRPEPRHLQPAVRACAAHLQWTQSQLNPEQLAWLRNLPLTAELGDCLFAHANVHDPAHWEYLHGRWKPAEACLPASTAMCFVAMCTNPACITSRLQASQASSPWTPPHAAVTSAPVAGHSGSLGQPRDGNPAACYATFDASQAVLTYFRVPYDHEMAAHRVLTSGMPRPVAQALAERLIHGR